MGDIKDGLLKLMLYTNLENVEINGRNLDAVPILKLTSEKISGSITSTSSKKELGIFFSDNSFSKRETGIIKDLFEEAEENDFLVVVEWATT